MKLFPLIKKHITCLTGKQAVKLILTVGSVGLLANCAPVAPGAPGAPVAASGGTKMSKHYVAGTTRVTWSGKKDSQGYATGYGKQRHYARNGRLLCTSTGTMVRGKFNGSVTRKYSHQSYSTTVIYSHGRIVRSSRYPYRPGYRPGYVAPRYPYRPGYRYRPGFFR